MFATSSELPPSKPNNWPRSTEAEIAARPKRIVNVGSFQDYSFCNNSIKTSNYEWYNFLPKFLLEEFNPHYKIANCYFIVISGMQCIPQISNTNGYPTVLIPLVAVLVIAAFFKILEDVGRHRADRKANSSKVERFSYGKETFTTVLWSALQVGDFIRLRSYDIFPADVLVIQVSEPHDEPMDDIELPASSYTSIGNTPRGKINNNFVPTTPNNSKSSRSVSKKTVVEAAEVNQVSRGVCYVETKSLDGETNLKIRNAIPALLGKIHSTGALSDINGTVEMEHPNHLIDAFEGVVDFEEYGRSVINPNNVVLRGCVLRNTDWVIALVLNTGHDVKIMQSNTLARQKVSKLESSISKQIVSVMLLLIYVCVMAATQEIMFNEMVIITNYWYLKWVDAPVKEYFIHLFYEFLLNSSFIPVSLYITMSVVRVLQTYFMQCDLEMYYDPPPPLTEIAPSPDKIRNGFPMTVKTMSLNEELGQISHIFSDKTGTLTCNNMDFRKACINGISYGLGLTEVSRASYKLKGEDIPPEFLEAEEVAQAEKAPHVSFYDPLYDEDLNYDGSNTPNTSGKGGHVGVIGSALQEVHKRQQKDKIRDFYRYLSICHEVMIEAPVDLDQSQRTSKRRNSGDGSYHKPKQKKNEGVAQPVKYSASNPDDEALIYAAKYFGYEFVDRTHKTMTIRETATGLMIIVEILLVIPFSSVRKRMSIIIRDTDGKIKIITKGADSMMVPRMVKGIPGSEQDERLKSTIARVDQYSDEGLRCLMMGYAVVPNEKYAVWSKDYSRALCDHEEMRKRKVGLLNDIDILEDFLESNLDLLGATAIEDKLQGGVSDCIEALTAAGIKIWVLTGDKEGTAVNIALACSLLLPPTHMRLIRVTNQTQLGSVLTVLRAEVQKMKSGSSKRSGDNRALGLVVDGASLIIILNSEEAKTLLRELGGFCQAVVCCRVSPSQKQQIVLLTKDFVKDCRTLAIGDGANDVAMIKAAHVGVGINGAEGVAAVNAADYTIGQFRYLTHLLLKHGRYNYIRMCHTIVYMFYKNILLSLCNLWFSPANAFSSQKYFTEGAIQLFNLFYSCFPILLYGAYDKDIPVEDVFRFPQLYKYCRYDHYFNSRVFWQWIRHATVDSMICTGLSLILLTGAVSYITGNHLGSYVENGALCFTALVFVVNLKVFMFQCEWTWFHGLIMLLTIGSWFLVAYVINVYKIVDFNFYDVWNNLLGDGTFWLSLLLIVTTVMMKDAIEVTVKRHLCYTNIHILQEMAVARESKNSDMFGLSTYFSRSAAPSEKPKQSIKNANKTNKSNKKYNTPGSPGSFPLSDVYDIDEPEYSYNDDGVELRQFREQKQARQAKQTGSGIDRSRFQRADAYKDETQEEYDQRQIAAMMSASPRSEVRSPSSTGGRGSKSRREESQEEYDQRQIAALMTSSSPSGVRSPASAGGGRGGRSNKRDESQEDYDRRQLEMMWAAEERKRDTPSPSQGKSRPKTPTGNNRDASTSKGKATAGSTGRKRGKDESQEEYDRRQLEMLWSSEGTPAHDDRYSIQDDHVEYVHYRR